MQTSSTQSFDTFVIALQRLVHVNFMQQSLTENMLPVSVQQADWSSVLRLNLLFATTASALMHGGLEPLHIW